MFIWQAPLKIRVNREKKNEAAKALVQNKQNMDENSCFFYNKPRHVKKEYTKYHA